MEMTRRDVLGAAGAALATGAAGPALAGNTPPWAYHTGCLTLSFEVKAGSWAAQPVVCDDGQTPGPFALPLR